MTFRSFLTAVYTQELPIKLFLPTSILIINKMVGTTGIEPVTPAMSMQCSPAELRAQVFLNKIIVLP